MKTLLFFCLLFVFFLQPIDSDGDFYHHLAIGRSVVEKHTLPSIDQFTFTASGKPFVAYAWGAGVLYYVLYSHFGALAINLLNAFIAVLTFFLLYLFLLVSTGSYTVSLLTEVCLISVVLSRWPSRPELFMYPLLISLLLLDQMASKQPKLFFFIPLIILLWANLYGASVFLGLAILILLFIRRRTILFSLSVFVSFLVSFLNGYGLKSVFYIFFIPAVARYQGEWAGILSVLKNAPSDYLLDFEYRFIIYLAFLGIFLLLVLFSLKKLKNHRFLFLLSLTVFSPFLANRQIPLAAFLSAPLFAVLLTQQKGKKKRVLLIMAGLVSLITVFLSIRLTPPRTGEDSNTFPIQLVQFIKKNNISGRVFNTQRIGGFLSYHLYPQLLTFTDTRDDLFLDIPIFYESQNLLSRGQSILPLVDRYHVDIIVADLTESQSYQGLFYSNRWLPVYLTDTYAVFLPQTVVSEKQLSFFSAIDPYAKSGAKENQLQQAEEEYRMILSHLPEKNRNNILFRLASVLIKQKKYDQAVRTLNQITLPHGPTAQLVQKERDRLLNQVDALPKK